VADCSGRDTGGGADPARPLGGRGRRSAPPRPPERRRARRLAADPLPYPAELQVERVVSSSALVAFEGNRYSVPHALADVEIPSLARYAELAEAR
jgi:hypothetical protein